MRLNANDQGMLDGHGGSAAQMAMRILLRMAEIYGAGRLINISAAHIDSTIYLGEATLEFAERLAFMDAKVVVPTTLNVSGVDEQGWQAWGVPAEWAEKARRQMVAYESMGCVPTWTCAPYQTAYRPVFGQQIAWGESNAIAFANSVIGARTERYPDLLDICAAITGRVPAVGLHMTENRAGQILLRLVDVPLQVQRDSSFYPVLGHLMGRLAKDRVPVVEGMAVSPSEDQLKALGAAAASSGTVGLFHLVGITPEAGTLSDAFQGRKPQVEVIVDMDLLRGARKELNTGTGKGLDMVVVGCPHFSSAEFEQLSHLLTGQECHPRVKLLVATSRENKANAEAAGFLDLLTAFGGSVTVDTCILASPMLPPEIKVLMTNSGKCAYYTPGLLNVEVVFGTLEDCVRSAVAGRAIVDDSPWND